MLLKIQSRIWRKKVDENTQKFNATERKIIAHDYTMIEDNQNVEAFKKELGKKVDTLETKILDMNKTMVDVKNLMERKEYFF